MSVTVYYSPLKTPACPWTLTHPPSRRPQPHRLLAPSTRKHFSEKMSQEFVFLVIVDRVANNVGGLPMRPLNEDMWLLYDQLLEKCTLPRKLFLIFGKFFSFFLRFWKINEADQKKSRSMFVCFLYSMNWSFLLEDFRDIFKIIFKRYFDERELEFASSFTFTRNVTFRISFGHRSDHVSRKAYQGPLRDLPRG